MKSVLYSKDNCQWCERVKQLFAATDIDYVEYKYGQHFTKEQFLTLKNLLLDLKEQFPDAKIMGHNEVSSKACPSFDVQKWLYENEFVKPVQITTPEEKELLEKKRKEYVGEQLELFIKKEQ